MASKASLDGYTRFYGNNPFGSQSKMLYYIDRINGYLRDEITWPVFMEINPTNRCNLRCPWCISQNFRGKETIKADSLIRFLVEFSANKGKGITFSGGGEPTQHPKFLSIVRRSRMETSLKFALMTNGVYPKSYNEVIGQHLQWVRFSLDTANPEKYKEWKGLSCVNQVLENIQDLHRNYPIRVGINCNIGMWHTREDIQGLLDLMPDTAAYLQFRPVLPRYFKREKIEINWEVWEWLLAQDLESVNLSNDKLRDLEEGNAFPFHSCEGHFFNPILNANGDLCVCMYHPNDRRFVFGNIYEKGYRQIWLSKQRQDVIEFVRNVDYQEHCQMCCKLTEINKFIDFVTHPEDGTDKEFL